MASCVIFKAKKHYKIYTESITKEGLLIADDPIFILDITIGQDILWETIIKSLNASKIGVKAPQRDEWSQWQGEILKKLKESSFNNLYKKTTSCQIKLEQGKLIIQQLAYKTNMGLQVKDEIIHNFNSSVFNENEYKYIEDVLNFLGDG